MTLSSLKLKQARGNTLTLHMLTGILALPVEEVRSRFTSAEILKDKIDFDRSKFLDVQSFLLLSKV